jgi:GDP-6-deoxy-D-talose 4-dehydrogenase
MRVLISGIDGFTGIYLEKKLIKKGYEVVGLKSDLTNIDGLNKEIAFIQPEVVVHLAGLSFINHKEVSKFYEINLIGSLNLLNALERHAENIHSILLVSSANIYDSNYKNKIQESFIINPRNDYAVSKLSMEYMAQLWIDRLPVFLVRPFNYTGVGQSQEFLIPKIVSHFRNKKRVIELGNIDIYREFGDVRDVVDIYTKLIEKKQTGKIFNICTGKSYSIKEVIKLCERVSGHCITIKSNTNLIRDNDAKSLYGDNSYLMGNISKTKWYDLEDTINWMLLHN